MNFDRMRALLLDQAIRGLLDEGNPTDSVVPVVEGCLKKESYPFEVPDSWRWYPLGKILEYGKATQVSSDQISETTWVLDLEDIEKGTGRLVTKKRGTPTTSNKAKFSKGDVLYGKLRPYLNKVVIADEAGVCTTEIVPISVKTAKVALSAEYLKSYLMSPFFLDYANKISYGVKMPRLGTKDAKAALIPVPPIEEQVRIVAKLNEAFAEIDRAEKAYQELQTLSGVLRGQILHEAIQGKLVPQLDSEEAVEQIGDAPEDVPFAIPEKWKWYSAKDVYQLLSGRDLTKSEILEIKPNEQSFPYITGASQIHDSSIVINRWTKECVVKSQIGDLLLTCKGTVGKTAINTVGDLHIARQIMALRPNKSVMSVAFLRLFIDTLSKRLAREAKSMIPGIDRKALMSKPVPVPPLQEQKRIVEMVDELFKQVEALSSK